MELTVHNLQRLRALLHAELEASSTSTSDAASSPAKHSPKGSKGNREYFVASRNRWIRKSLVQGGKDGKRRYRVLYRQPTPVDQLAALPRASESRSQGSADDTCEDKTAALEL